MMIINPYFFIILPIIIAAILYIFPYKKVKLLSLILQGLVFIASISNYANIRSVGEKFFTITNANASFGVTLKLDILSCIMIMLTSFMFLYLLIYNYKKIYMSGLFLFLFVILESLIIGLFSANDLFTIYVLIEVSTIVVSILIMYKKDSESVYDGMIYLMVNIVSMTFYLLGIGFVYKIFGTLDISSIAAKMHLVQSKNTLAIPFALILTSLSLKSALMPLFSWLPRAHGSKSSPSIVSALLSGLYIKIGLFLFIRITLLFNPVINSSEFFIVTGIITGIVGFILSISQKDIKLILAYSTISQVGLIMIGLNTGSSIGFYGSIYHIMNHAIFKSNLFLTAGILEEKYNTRDISKIRGILKNYPVVSIAMILSILGITGAPLFNASLSKYLIQSSFKDNLTNYMIMLINLGTIIIFVKYIQMFFDKSKNTTTKVSINRKVIIIFLGVLTFLGGILGTNILSFLFNQNFYISISEYIHKSLIYVVSLFIGFIIFEFLKKKPVIMQKIRHIELSFNNICLSIAIFFMILLGYVRFIL